MKASERRARQRDIARRRCPQCRNRNLSDLGMDVVWCDACGKTDVTDQFPYQSFYAPKEGK